MISWVRLIGLGWVGLGWGGEGREGWRERGGVEGKLEVREGRDTSKQ